MPGAPRGRGSALGNLGIAYARLGQAEKAAGLWRQAKAIGEAIKDPRIIEAMTRALKSLEKGADVKDSK